MRITRQLIAEIIEAEIRTSSPHHDGQYRPVPGEPATRAALSRLERALGEKGLSLPPSYRELLSVADGISEFSWDVSLCGIEQLLAPPHPSHARRYPSLSRFIIGRASSLEFIAFDPDTRSPDGEMAVVWVADNGEESRATSFRELLREHRDALLEKLARAKKPAKKLVKRAAKKPAKSAAKKPAKSAAKKPATKKAKPARRR